MNCEICGCNCTEDSKFLHVNYCKGCKIFYMIPDSGSKSMEDVDYEKFEKGFRYLREKNFKKILSTMNKLLQTHSKGLEIGCGPGWFLELANEHYDCRGIEPNTDFLLEEKIEQKIFRGWYPDDLPTEVRELDFIIYNDVFEHLSDCNNQLEIAHRLLKTGGYLVINCPWNTGILFNVARMLAKLGFSGYYKRLWQVETYTPHLYYFSIKSLQKIGKDNGFSLIVKEGLQTVTTKGLKERVDCLDSNKKNGFKVFLLRIIIPLMSISPKDTGFVILKKDAR